MPSWKHRASAEFAAHDPDNAHRNCPQWRQRESNQARIPSRQSGVGRLGPPPKEFEPASSPGGGTVDEHDEITPAPPPGNDPGSLDKSGHSIGRQAFLMAVESPRVK